MLLRPKCVGISRRISHAWRCASFAPVRSYSVRKEFAMEDFPVERIRNFGIIAHVDHGKSTIADRLLEITGTIDKDRSNRQVLDKLNVERERGITVKAQSASLVYEYKGTPYLINLVDTPGHVDFSYEVSRSLAACQGILLVVDASQGIQAQTIANFYLAFSQNLSIIPVINKIDLPHADIPRVKQQLETTLELDASDAVEVSAKSGLNIESILHAIIERIPPPIANLQHPMNALLFDSWYDDYKGVICLVAMLHGRLQKGDKVMSAHSKRLYEVTELGIMYPDCTARPAIQAGQVGYIVTNMKNAKESHIGDVFHDPQYPTQPLEGFQQIKPMVYAGVYPIDSADYDKLDAALDKLTLNDGSVSVSKESSSVLGQGFRLGFLGMLHLDVFRQRLEEEYRANVVITSPSVPYIVTLASGEVRTIQNPHEFPDRDVKVADVQEPFIEATMTFPESYTGAVMDLCQKRRGIRGVMDLMNDDRMLMRYRLPISEVADNHFFNELKRVTSGYASFDYEDSGYESSDIVKMEVRLRSEPVDALTKLVHRDSALKSSREMVTKLAGCIKRELYQISIQVLVDGKILASETVKQLRKDVTAKCYGGDITRKRKLLEKQKEGKKRLKLFGKVELSHEAFLNILKK